MPSKGELVCITTLLAAAPGLEILVFPSWMAGLRVSAQSFKAIWNFTESYAFKMIPRGTCTTYLTIAEVSHQRHSNLAVKCIHPSKFKEQVQKQMLRCPPNPRSLSLVFTEELDFEFLTREETWVRERESRELFHATFWANICCMTKWKVILTPDFPPFSSQSQRDHSFLTAGE